MPILEQDIKLLQSQVPADVPEGGGAATGIEIVDNVSNNIFADISELDRILGAVSLRLGYLGVRTPTTDTYFGARVIIGTPPSDPKVSALLFHPSAFDRRTDMQRKIESYLTRGPKWPGYLYDNHVEGQKAIVIMQRTEAALPEVGKTLALIGNEGQASEYVQFVRITKVSSVARDFTISDGSGLRTFRRNVVTCDISDRLLHDFYGAAATDLDGGVPFAGKAVIRDTIVADAARYYGASPLVQPASMGDPSARVASIHTALVPSAQTETPIADARINQRTASPQPAAAAHITLTTSALLSPTSSLYLGGSFYPGSLSIVSDGVTLTDVAGALRNGATAVGVVDYVSGVVSGIDGGPSFYGTKLVTYRPAGVPTVPTETLAIPVTAQSRSASLSVTLVPTPAPGTLNLSFMSGGRWYVLSDTGAGAIRGADTAFGAGSLSFVTGSLLVTLGALPDVGSDILLSWGTSGFHGAVDATTSRGHFAGSLGQPAAPGSVSITWDGLAVADDGKGRLAGAGGAGTIEYATGDWELEPDVIPPQGTTWSATFSQPGSAQTAGTVATFTDMGPTWEGSLGAGFIPGSFSAEAEVIIDDYWQGKARRRIVDNGAGKLVLMSRDASGVLSSSNEIGTINAATGLFTITKYVTLSTSVREIAREGVTVQGINGTWSVSEKIVTSTSAVFVQGSPALTNVRYAAGGTSAQTANGAFTALRVRIPKPAGASLVSGSVTMAADGIRLQDRLGRVVRDIDPATGAGADVGPLDYIGGVATLDTWVGMTSQPIALAGALVQYGDVLVATAAFRTPTAPLRPASLSVVATRQRDGAVVVGQADVNGYINTPDVVGVVNVQTGVARVWFRKATGDAAEQIDLTSFGIPGVTTVYADVVYADTLRCGAVAYTYLPLDASIIGLDPVRLPTDGRVPIFRPGDVAVVHHTAATAPATVSNGQTLSVGRGRLARLRVIGSDGVPIGAGFTPDLDAGEVTFTAVAGYAQPVTIEHMIKDELPVADAQINGQLTFTRPLSHNFPLGSIVSSALLVGNLFARVPLLFDQQTWTGEWSDDRIGAALSAQYNEIQYPIAVTNLGAVTERWAIRFKNTTAFELIGEHLGFIAEGDVAHDFAPLNPAAGQPYFTLRAAGWGGGWPQGGVLRMNTVGALHPIGLARTVQQGDATLQYDKFTLMILGDRDRV